MQKDDERLLKTPLSEKLPENLKTIRLLFGLPLNADLVLRHFCVCGLDGCLVYLEGMAGNRLLDEGVLSPLMRAKLPEELAASDCAGHIAKRVLSVSEAEESESFEEICSGVLDGKSALFLDGCPTALILETRNYEKREVSRPNAEAAVVGAQQGFVENLRSNLTLIRRILRTNRLTTEMKSLGKKIPTKVALLYLRGTANEDVLREIRRRLDSLNVNEVTDSGQLAALIEDSPFSLVPQILQTERPDRAASCLSEGQIAIMVDNSPYALIAPITVFHLLHAADDSFMRWQYGSFARIMRLGGILISLFLPAVYLAVTMYHAHMIPMGLLTSVAETRARVPFPILVEILIMELSFYLINEAGTRIPSQIGPALSIVGALILGQAAVAADMISPILIIVAAITGLGTYAVPTYGMGVAIEILRLGPLLAAAFLGLFGIVLTAFLYLCALCALSSFGVPMLAPFAPHRPHNPDLLLRLPLWTQKRFPFLARFGAEGAGKAPMRGWKGGKS